MSRLLIPISLLVALACRAAPSADLDPAARQAIADTVRAESERMVATMRTRQVDSVLAFYGKQTAYVGDGVVGDWTAILASAPGRYATYTKVECSWPDPLRIDVLGRTAAVVTGILHCEKADTTGATWVEHTARTEVVAIEDGRWRIIAVHESIRPGTGALR